MTTTIRALFAGLIVAVFGAVASPAAADVPLPIDGNPVVDATGNRAHGFTVTFQAGGRWTTGSLHAELAACRAEYPRGSTSRHKCAAIVRSSMRDYAALRAARIAANPPDGYEPDGSQ